MLVLPWSNQKFARMEELYSLKNGMTPPAKLELEQSHTDILSPRNCPPLIEAAVFDCFVFLILAVWLVRNRHLQSCSNKGSNHLLSFTPAYLQFQLQPRFAELKHLILGWDKIRHRNMTPLHLGWNRSHLGCSHDWLGHPACLPPLPRAACTRLWD